MRVDVTQFLRPDGRKRKVWMDDMPDDLAPIVKLIKKSGCSITAEQLNTGDISLAIQSEHGDVCMELCDNGPGENGTRAALERLIRGFSIDKLKVCEDADDGCGVGWGT